MTSENKFVSRKQMPDFETLFIAADYPSFLPDVDITHKLVDDQVKASLKAFLPSRPAGSNEADIALKLTRWFAKTA